jgi:hypothetical protein
MRLGLNISAHLFRQYGIKTVIGILVLTIVVLVPLHAASADSEAACAARGGVWRLTTIGIIDGSYACYGIDGLGRPLPEDQHATLAGKDVDLNNGGIGSTLATWISDIVYVFTVGLGSLVAYMASYFFNFAVYLSLNSAAYGLQVLSDGWTTVRDIANMAFIFILIYIAVTVMLKAETSKTMGMLAKVIAIALLINFSFFFVRVVIDGGNILAVQFYNAMSDTTVQQTISDQAQKGTVISTAGIASTGGLVLSQKTKDLTASIMGAVDVTNILTTKSFKQFSDQQGSGPGAFFGNLIALSFTYICVGIIFGMLAAAFFAAGFKFLSRIAILWAVIVSAPLAFVLYAIPNSKTQGYAKQWGNALVSYSIYPAVFLFMFLLITFMAKGLAGNSGSILGEAFGDINQSGASGLAFIANIIGSIGIRLGLLMILIYIAMRVSDAVAKSGGEWAQRIAAAPDRWGQRLSRLGTLPQRLTGAAVTRPVGAGASRFNTALNNSTWANSSKWYNPLSLGARAAQRGILAPATNVSILGEKKYGQYKNEWSAEMAGRASNRSTIENKRKEVESKEKEKLDVDKLGNMSEKEKGGAEFSAPEQEEFNRLSNQVNRLSKSDLESIKKADIERIIHVLNDEQVKRLKESDKFSNAEKDSFEKLWNSSSKNSPLKKANEQIKALRKVSDELKADHIILSGIEDKIGSESDPQRNVTIKLQDVEKMRDSIEDQADSIRDYMQKSPRGENLAGQRQTLRTLKKATKQVEILEESVKNIPANIGGTDKRGSFVTED